MNGVPTQQGFYRDLGHDGSNGVAMVMGALLQVYMSKEYDGHMEHRNGILKILQMSVVHLDVVCTHSLVTPNPPTTNTEPRNCCM